MPESMENEYEYVETPDMKKAVFSIPDFYRFYKLNMDLISLWRAQPELFRPDVEIGSVYGSFPGFCWNSGRATIGQADYKNIVATVKAFNDLGISVRYTCTNSLLTEKHFNDYYANKILEITESSMNGVTVNLPTLDQYISYHYPKFYHVWSTTKGVKSISDTNAISADRLTVAYYGFNNTTAIRKLEHPENIEILVCEACIPNCPNRKEHYEDISKLHITEPSKGFTCPHNCEIYYYYETVTKRRHYVTWDQIKKEYLPRGIYQFKISGRNDNPVNVIENYVNYFAKPEHKDNVRNKLLIELGRTM